MRPASTAYRLVGVQAGHLIVLVKQDEDCPACLLFKERYNGWALPFCGCTALNTGPLLFLKLDTAAVGSEDAVKWDHQVQFLHGCLSRVCPQVGLTGTPPGLQGRSPCLDIRLQINIVLRIKGCSSERGHAGNDSKDWFHFPSKADPTRDI